MRRFWVFCAFWVGLVSLPSVFSQILVPSRLLVGNGGVWGPANFATLASWDLANGNYQIHDSIPAAFVSDLEIQGNQVFLAADSFLVSYDLATLTRTGIALVPGIRHMAVWDTLVIVTRGYGATQDYVQAYGRQSLGLVWSVSNLTGECEGIAVWGDSAYVGEPVSFLSDTGMLAVIDLSAGQMAREMSMDTLGAGVGRVFANQGIIMTVNSISWGSPYGAIGHHFVGQPGLNTFRVETHVGAGAGIYNNFLFADFGQGIGSFAQFFPMLFDTVVVPGTFAGMAVDTFGGNFYATKSDFFSYGWLYKYDNNGAPLDSVPCGISPEALALDYTPYFGSHSASANDARFSVFPNPFEASFTLLPASPSPWEARWFNLGGQLCGTQTGIGTTVLSPKGLSPGMYILELTQEGVSQFQKLIAR